MSTLCIYFIAENPRTNTLFLLGERTYALSKKVEIPRYARMNTPTYGEWFDTEVSGVLMEDVEIAGEEFYNDCEAKFQAAFPGHSLTTCHGAIALDGWLINTNMDEELPVERISEVVNLLENSLGRENIAYHLYVDTIWRQQQEDKLKQFQESCKKLVEQCKIAMGVPV